MVKRINDGSSDLEFIPQAILSLPISHFAKKFGEFIKNHDDFDEFEGAFFVSGNGIPFALKRYAGYPKDTTTIYLPVKIRDVEWITKIVADIVSELDLAPKWIEWQRANGPEL